MKKKCACLKVELKIALQLIFIFILFFYVPNYIKGRKDWIFEISRLRVLMELCVLSCAEHCVILENIYLWSVIYLLACVWPKFCELSNWKINVCNFFYLILSLYKLVLAKFWCISLCFCYYFLSIFVKVISTRSN